jgi:hypothetical protein
MSKAFRIALGLSVLVSSSLAGAEAPWQPETAAKALEADFKPPTWEFYTTVNFATVKDTKGERVYGYDYFYAEAAHEVYSTIWTPGMFSVDFGVSGFHTAKNSLTLELFSAIEQRLTKHLSLVLVPFTDFTDHSYVESTEKNYGKTTATPGILAAAKWKWNQWLTNRLKVIREIGVAGNSLAAFAVAEVDIGKGFSWDLAYGWDLLNPGKESGNLAFAYAF